MTVLDLITQLKKYPNDREVRIEQPSGTASKKLYPIDAIILTTNFVRIKIDK